MLYRNLHIYEAWKKNWNLNPEMYKNETGKHYNNKLSKKIGGRGWRDGSAVKNTGGHPEDMGLISGTHVGQLMTISNPSSRRKNALF